MEKNISRICRTTSQTFLLSLWCNSYMTSHHVVRQPCAAHNLSIITIHIWRWYPHNKSINLVYKYFYSCNCYKTVDTKCSEWWMAHLYAVCLTHESLLSIWDCRWVSKRAIQICIVVFFYVDQHRVALWRTSFCMLESKSLLEICIVSCGKNSCFPFQNERV